MKPRTDPDALRKQLRWIAMDIGTSAHAIARFKSLLVEGSDDQRDTAAYHVAVQVLAERIGWAADLALIKMGEASMRTMESEQIAEAWMMPPRYHADCQASEAP